MKRYKTLAGLSKANREYIEELSKFVEKEREHLSMIQYEAASFGEAIVAVMKSKNVMMKDQTLAPSLRVMQALYYQTEVEKLYVDFFEYADDCFDGKLSELFDEENLVARVIH